jgi:hypothetical protein
VLSIGNDDEAGDDDSSMFDPVSTSIRLYVNCTSDSSQSDIDAIADSVGVGVDIVSVVSAIVV